MKQIIRSLLDVVDPLFGHRRRNVRALLAEHEALKTERTRHIDHYLSLMQSCLTGTLYKDPPLKVLWSQGYDSTLRESGLDWPSRAHTMIGRKRLQNLRVLTEQVIQDGVPGDFIETGVWRGGACILMRAILSAYGINDRRVWLADSFSGLPKPDETQYPADQGDEFHTYTDLAVSQAEVEDNFRQYDLLDEQVVFLKGWFKDTLPTLSAEKFALLRLDGDMYESTIVALNHLYPSLSINGYIIIDDYHTVPACKKAISDYCQTQGLTPDIQEIDGAGVFWKKTA